MRRQFTGNRGTIALHALAWIILIILPQFLFGRYSGNNSFFTWWFFVNTATYLIIFYVNYLILVPRLFFRDRRLVYFLSAVVLIASVCFLTEFANETCFRRQRAERMIALSDSLGSDSLIFDGQQAIPEDRNFRITDDSNRNLPFSQSTERTFRNQQDTLLNQRFVGDSTRRTGPPDNATGFGPPPVDDDDRISRLPDNRRRIFRMAVPSPGQGL